MNYIELNRSSLSKDNYVIKATFENNYWFGLEESRIEKLKIIKGNNFSVIIFGSSREGDFYILPFILLSDVLTKYTLINSETRKRWVGDIKFHHLNIRNYEESIDISNFYGNASILNGQLLGDEEENEYSIANRRMEVNARLKQSKFRTTILKNYENKCCISGVRNKDLLVASHIIPWSTKMETRLDPSNGLCLFVLFDKLFDLGYISIDYDLKIMISKQISQDLEIMSHISKILGKYIRLPLKNPPKREYLEYHRNNIFRG